MTKRARIEDNTEEVISIQASSNSYTWVHGCSCFVNLQVKAPRKRLYRARAHSNPLNDNQFPIPTRPEEYNWWATHLRR